LRSTANRCGLTASVDKEERSFLRFVQIQVEVRLQQSRPFIGQLARQVGLLDDQAE
jgi:hypothetical protein